MPEIIVLIVLFISILGIGLIILRKIPALSDFTLENTENKGIFGKLKEEIKNNIAPRTASSGEVLLLKALSKARILFLKGEGKITGWLSVLRQKSAQKNRSFSDSYWDKLKIRKTRKLKNEDKEKDSFKIEIKDIE